MTRLTATQAATADANRGLVTWTVNAIGVPAHLRDDAWQDGFIGLCRAIQLHDGRDGFTRYAVGWIRSGIDDGRRTRDGINYRRHPATYTPPISIDGHDPLDTVDIEDDVCARLAAADLEAALIGACDTVVDVDIACALIADAQRHATVDRAIAAAHGCTPEYVTNRRRLLRRRLDQAAQPCTPGA